MKIYLMRHGEADQSEPKNPLTPNGKNQIEHIANFLEKANLQIELIFHSSKLRAEQTAQIVAKHCHLKNSLHLHEHLKPLDSIDIVAYEIQQSSKSTLFVGHMPFMGKLASKLITGEENHDVTTFHTGSIICLEKLNHFWSIQWALYPELLTNRIN